MGGDSGIHQLLIAYYVLTIPPEGFPSGQFAFHTSILICVHPPFAICVYLWLKNLTSMKKRLFTPGPTPVPEQVMLRMAEPLIHHRSPEFREIMGRVNANLRYLFQTSQPVLPLASSGTGGMESTFVSLFSPGDTIISVNGGKFGERWVQMPRVFGLNAVEIRLRWGEALREEQLLEALRDHPDAKAVYLTQSETSTGTLTDVRAMARLVHERSSALVCVDGISSIGAQEMRFDDWGVDVCVTGSPT